MSDPKHGLLEKYTVAPIPKVPRIEEHAEYFRGRVAHLRWLRKTFRQSGGRGGHTKKDRAYLSQIVSELAACQSALCALHYLASLQGEVTDPLSVLAAAHQRTESGS